MLLLTIIAVALSEALALPICNGGLVHYQTMPCYYRPGFGSMENRLMYVHYMHSPQGRVRAANDGISTFVSADAIGTPAFVKDAEQEHVYEDGENQSMESSQSNLQQDTVSIAQSYPDESIEEAVTDLINADDNINNLPEVMDYEDFNGISNEYDIQRKGKAPTRFNNGNHESDETTHVDALTERVFSVTQDTVGINGETLPPDAIINSSPLPAFSATYLPPRKKIRVELETPNEESDEFPYSIPMVNTKTKSVRPAQLPPQNKPPQQRPPQNRPPQNRPQQSKPRQPLPSGTFFPINFGGTSGGAIAIANSFSTGDGGSATSHATAYGNPSGRNISKKRNV